MSILGRDGDDHRVTTHDATHRMVTGIRPSSVARTPPEKIELENSGSHAYTSSATSSTSAPMVVPPRRIQRVNRTTKSRGPSTLEVDPEAALSDAVKSRWWGKIWAPDARGGMDGQDNYDDDDETSSQYQSLETPELPQRPSLLSSAISHATVTVEDRLKQDCSFFYQGMEVMTPQSSRRGLQPLASVLSHSGLLSTAEGTRFRATYERLNQDVALAVDTHDLFFDEPSSPPRYTHGAGFVSSTQNLSQNTEKLSTLFFEQDGRMLMKLPRDQVRLIMDPGLEPGILSVEQWRKVDPTIFDPAGPLVGDEEDGRMVVLDDPDSYPTMKMKQLPELRYVMTVPDDLYRRVVAEMSYALMPPWWGCFMCCSESEGRADIKLALAILSVTLFLMFVSTMEWPTD